MRSRPLRIAPLPPLPLLVTLGLLQAASAERATVDVEQGAEGEVDDADEAPAVSVEWVTLEEYHRHRLDVPPLISAVSQIERRFPPWHARPEWCGTCGQHPRDDDGRERSSSLAELGRGEEEVEGVGAQNRSGHWFDLPRAVARAMIPTPSAGSCSEARIDLTFLGYPGLSVILGFEGDLSYDVCNMCFTWRFKAVLGFEYGLTFFGHGLLVRSQLKGEVNLREMRCEDASEAPFCQYLHLFLPAERGQLIARESICHSDSPFEILKAWLKFQWNSLRQSSDLMGNITTGVERDLKVLEVGLRKYIDLFQLAPQAARSPQASMQKPARWTTSIVTSWTDDGARYVWQPPRAGRLCFSEKTPPASAVAGEILDATGLQRFCPASLKLADIGSVAADTRNVRVTTNNGPTLLLTGSADNVKDMARKLYASQWSEEVAGGRAVTFQCEVAKLKEATKFPYCMVETLSQAFSTQVAKGRDGKPLKQMQWKEEVTLGVHDFEDVVVSIADRKREGVALGQARFRVCAAGSRAGGTRWSTISKSAACEENDDKAEIERIGYLEKTKSLSDCQAWCASLPGCAAVDYFSRSGWCNFFPAACRKPKSRHHGSSSYRLASLGCHHTLPAASSKPSGGQVTRPLVLIQKDWKGSFDVKQVGAVRVRLTALPSADAKDRDARLLPNMRLEAQALFVAFRQWFGKIPDYAEGLIATVLGTAEDSDEGRDINYAYLDGRFMARWPTSGQRRGMDTFGRRDAKRVQRKKKKEKKSFWQNVRSKAQTWWGEVSNAVQTAWDDRPCVEALLSDDDKHDDRVLSFKRALTESKQVTHMAHRLDFYSELSSSLGNLLVRSVKDIHALFGVYFADDPSWDGDCVSLKPEFDLPYEFGDEKGEASQKFEWRPPPTRPPKAQRLFVNHRTAGQAGVRGEKMDDKSNPFCLWPWISGEQGQEERAGFAAMDAPDASAVPVPPREQSSRLHPHIWCHLVKATREGVIRKEATPSEPFLAAEYADGMGLTYRAACHQLYQMRGGGVRMWNRYECETAVVSAAMLTILPSLSHFIRDGFASVGRDLEDVLQCTGRITPSMRQFESADDDGRTQGFSAHDCTGTADFQNLVNEADNMTQDGKMSWEVFSLEAACEKNSEGIKPFEAVDQTSSLHECKDLCEKAGNCAAVDYYHKGGHCNLYTRACSAPKAVHDGASSHALRKSKPLSKKHLALVAFVHNRTQALINNFMKFLKELESKQVWDKVNDDFQKAFAYEDLGRRGAVFTGTLWKEGLDFVHRDLGTKEGLHKYMEMVKEHLVLKAWRQRNQQGIHAVFPPPVRYDTTLALSLGVEWTSSRGQSFFCERNNPHGVEIEVAWRNGGGTWEASSSPFDVEGGRPCIQLRLMPTPSLMLNPGLCVGLRKDPLNGGNISWDLKWYIDAMSIVSEKKVDVKEKIREKLNDLQTMLLKSVSSDKTAIEDSELNDVRHSSAWQILKSTLMDPKVYYDLATGATSPQQLNSQLWVAGKKLVHHLKEAGKKLARELLASKLVQELKKSVKKLLDLPWNLQAASRNILTASIELSRLGDGPWVKSFSLHYIRRLQVDFSVDVPGAGSARTSFLIQGKYDMSEVFNVIFRFATKKEAESAYGCCVRCLADPGTAFCRFSAPANLDSGQPRNLQCMHMPERIPHGQSLEMLLGCEGEVSDVVEDCSAVVNEDEEYNFDLPLLGCGAPEAMSELRSSTRHLG